MRIGHGYDLHAHGTGRGLWLGGVFLEDAPAVEAHSDGDVVLHAVTDALLGALALGDLGQWFPDDDEAHRDRPGAELLETVLREVTSRGFRVGNVDITVLSQCVRVDPVRQRMRARVAELLQLEPGCVSVKATTTEGLGAIGRGEGIAAHAVLILVPRS